jgi:hypothetical protein
MILQKSFLSVLIIVFVSFYSLSAQPPGMQNPNSQQQVDISDADLEKFANAFKEIQVINQASQQQMIAVIQEEGMEVQRFNEIFQAEQNPNQKSEMNAEEETMFENINVEIKTIQKDSEKKMIGKIEDKGLSVNRYQQIMMAIQNNPEMQGKLQKHLQIEQKPNQSNK